MCMQQQQQKRVATRDAESEADRGSEQRREQRKPCLGCFCAVTLAAAAGQLVRESSARASALSYRDILHCIDLCVCVSRL